MPARILVLADARSLPALAGGLRENGFDVVAAATLDEARGHLAQPVQAAVVFYGTQEWTVPQALAALAPVREAQGQLVAVLQKQQAAARDECFRGGASECLFMPIPKDAFAARLQGLIDLAYTSGDGARAAVQVATRTTPAALEAATVTADGVHADAGLPFGVRQTVRVTWKDGGGSLGAWGQIASSAPARVRFAGQTPDEHARVRAWIAAATPAVQAVAPPAAPPVQAAPAAPPVQAAPEPPPPAVAAPLPTPPEGVTPVHVTPAPRPVSTEEELFGPSETPLEKPAIELGATWPSPWPVDWCRDAVAAILRDHPPRVGPPGGPAVAKRVLTKVTPSERALADKQGEAAPTPVREAIVARVALAGATADGEELVRAGGAVLVDAAAVASLVAAADAAGNRLQDAANKAIAKGDTETLRVLTGARSSLSQEVATLKKMADRLRGQGAAPSLHGLDPDVELRAVGKPRAYVPPAAPQQPVKRTDFGEAPSARRGSRTAAVWLAGAAILLVASLANFWISGIHPRDARDLELEKAGAGVVRIVVTKTSAMVTVTPGWLDRGGDNAPRLMDALAAMGVKKAAVQLADGKPLGVLDVAARRAALVGARPPAAATPHAPAAPAPAAAPTPAADKPPHDKR